MVVATDGGMPKFPGRMMSAEPISRVHGDVELGGASAGVQ
jgi:hypothetical protein